MPGPTQDDKLLAEILVRLRVIENKLDSLLAETQYKPPSHLTNEQISHLQNRLYEKIKQYAVHGDDSQHDKNEESRQPERSASSKYSAPVANVHYLWSHRPSLKERLNSICEPIRREKFVWESFDLTSRQWSDLLGRYEPYVLCIVAKLWRDHLEEAVDPMVKRQVSNPGEKNER